MKILLILCMFFTSIKLCAQDYFLFIGTYTSKGSKGIYVYRFNSQTGKAEYISSTDSIANPSYLATSENGKYLYAVNETGGQEPGSVSAFAFDAATGRLNFLNKQFSGGDHPCYVSVDKNNKWVVTANYSGGNLSVLPVASDGSLLTHVQLIQHEGKSVNEKRQDKPHVHAAVFSPEYNYIFAPDLGTDKIAIYTFDSTALFPLQLSKSAFASSTAGSGPRHLEFHPHRRFVYVIEELTGTIAVYKRNNGTLKPLQRIRTHPDAYRGAIGSADIHLSPDGKYLYATNRGDANSITIFSIRSNGKLTFKDYTPSMGVHPRNFIIDPTGNYLLIANRDTDNIAVYKRDHKTGLIEFTGQEICVSMPVCLKMIEIEE